jgi:hypothetical protein
MKIKFKRNDAGFNELRTRPATDARVKSEAENLATAANAIPSTTSPAATEPYYEVVDAGSEKRARYRVKTTSVRARLHDTKTQALLRGLSSG